jgi:hypothetical protein
MQLLQMAFIQTTNTLKFQLPIKTTNLQEHLEEFQSLQKYDLKSSLWAGGEQSCAVLSNNRCRPTPLTDAIFQLLHLIKMEMASVSGVGTSKWVLNRFIFKVQKESQSELRTRASNDKRSCVRGATTVSPGRAEGSRDCAIASINPMQRDKGRVGLLGPQMATARGRGVLGTFAVRASARASGRSRGRRGDESSAVGGREGSLDEGRGDGREQGRVGGRGGGVDGR